MGNFEVEKFDLKIRGEFRWSKILSIWIYRTRYLYAYDRIKR
ncbi:hypothetical protein HMPREF9099_02981 [Lachnospiraceae bacterium oral taxon 082 str. F0431]|nr:hypothetical protein HMPREF9099_02981 [Lachnospiraceae bacterium oral taxon 082 str. F0431]